MGIMQQLLQTKSADGGQEEEKSGGTGRGDRRKRLQRRHRKGTVRRRGCWRKRWRHSSNCCRGKSVQPQQQTDRSKTADDTGRRPELPAAVGPVINMDRGETRYSFLAGIAAHDGGGILSSGFQRQPRVVPTVLKGEKGRFQKIKHEFLLKENTLDISGHFASQGTRLIPVVDPLKHKAVLLRGVFSSEAIKGRIKCGTL